MRRQQPLHHPVGADEFCGLQEKHRPGIPTVFIHLDDTVPMEATAKGIARAYDSAQLQSAHPGRLLRESHDKTHDDAIPPVRVKLALL